MSSNKLHIDRSNYEEYFLLYLDGELNHLDRSAVEEFAALHQDLQQELTLFLSTRLNDEAIPFSHKEDLYAENIKLHTTDELLLLYIDNELSDFEKTNVKSRIEEDANLKNQFHQLQSLTLYAGDTVPLPYKKSLYHVIKRRGLPVIWYRAAALFILLFSALFLLNKIDRNETPAVGVIQNKKTSDTLSTPTALQSKILTPPVPIVSMKPGREQQKTIRRPPPAKELIAVQKQSTHQNIAAQPEAEIKKKDVINNVGNEIEKTALNTPLQQELNTLGVTTKASPAYNQTVATTPTMVKNMSATENSGKSKGSVRGFLRKASQFIERRTGINPVNDNNELYVGVLAIKL
jgi:hypothetical protein